MRSGSYLGVVYNVSTRFSPQAFWPINSGCEVIMSDTRILVIEDEEPWQEIVPRTLRRGLGDGVQIDVKGNYSDALEAIQNEDYDLISIDLELPDDVRDLEKSDLPGMILLKEIRKNPRNINCGLIILTAHPTFERVREALRSYKVWDFLDKFD